MQTGKTTMTRFSCAFLVALCAFVLAGPRPGEARESCGPEALGTARGISIGGEALPVGIQSYPRTLDLADHEVVLTFDDGPAAATGRILEALAKECVKATFFLIGRNAESLPAVVKREVDEGHSVGHHSYSHPDRTLRLMTDADARADIDRGIVAVERAAGAGRAAPFFRFPGYADTPALLAYLKGKGYTVFGSDLWASDWSQMTPKAQLDLVLGRLEKAGRGIVLFHDSRPQTAQMLPDFLGELKKRGYKVVHLVPGEGPTPVRGAAPGWASTTEPIIAKTLGGRGHGHAHENGRVKPDQAAPAEKKPQEPARPAPAETGQPAP